MPRYMVYGALLESSLPLPELGLPDAGGSAAPPLRVRWRAPGGPPPPLAEPFNEWRLRSGRLWLQFARTAGGEFVLTFPGLAAFLHDPRSGTIVARPEPGTPRPTVRHLLLDQAVPLCLSLRGRLVLHASASLTPGGAAAFLGRSGWGKSTLAAAMAEAGHPPVSDDCLVLERRAGKARAFPAYPGLRLWPDSPALPLDSAGRGGRVAHYHSKLRVNAAPSGRPARSVPLLAVFVLPDPAIRRAAGPPAIRRLRGAEAFMALARHRFQMEVDRPEALAAGFGGAADWAGRLPVYELSFRRGAKHLRETVRAIEYAASVLAAGEAP